MRLKAETLGLGQEFGYGRVCRLDSPPNRAKSHYCQSRHSLLSTHPRGLEGASPNAASIGALAHIVPSDASVYTCIHFLASSHGL